MRVRLLRLRRDAHVSGRGALQPAAARFVRDCSRGAAKGDRCDQARREVRRAARSRGEGPGRGHVPAGSRQGAGRGCPQERVLSPVLHASLEPWMVLTVEPGIYIAPDDDKAPEQFRGIGIRIEDDVLVTADGHEVLTAAVPKSVADVESLTTSAA